MRGVELKTRYRVFSFPQNLTPWRSHKRHLNLFGMDWPNGLPEVKSGKRFNVRKIIPTVRDAGNSEEAEMPQDHGKSACVQT